MTSQLHHTPFAVVVPSDLLYEAAEAGDEEGDESDDHDKFQFHFRVGRLHASMMVDFCSDLCLRKNRLNHIIVFVCLAIVFHASME